MSKIRERVAHWLHHKAEQIHPSGYIEVFDKNTRMCFLGCGFLIGSHHDSPTMTIVEYPHDHYPADEIGLPPGWWRYENGKYVREM